MVKQFDLAGGGIENWFAYVLALLFLLVRPEGLFREAHRPRLVLYRENGQFKSSYAADQQLLPIAQDRWFVIGLVVRLLDRARTGERLHVPGADHSVCDPRHCRDRAEYSGRLLRPDFIGTAAFMAVGAYAAYNLTIRVESLNFLIVVLAGGIAAFVGALFGIPSLRIKGLYLAVARPSPRSSSSIGCSLASSGLPITRHPARYRLRRSRSFGWTIVADAYLFVLSIAIVLTLTAKNLVRGHRCTWMAARTWMSPPK